MQLLKKNKNIKMLFFKLFFFRAFHLFPYYNLLPATDYSIL